MSDTLESAIEKLKMVREKLSEFQTKEEAIQFLVAETKLSSEECSIAYDFLVGLNFQNSEGFDHKSE